MRLAPRDYQSTAIVRLLATIEQARRGLSLLKSPQGIQFAAPTGTGKTVMMAAVIEALLAGNEEGAKAQQVVDPELTFLWLSDLPELNLQSLRRIQEVANGLAPDQLVEIDQDWDRPLLEPGKVYFLNYQKLRSGSLLTRLGDQRTSTIWESIIATQEARPGKLIVVIDEAHRGLGNQRLSQTTASKFVLGAKPAGAATPDPMIRTLGGERPLPPMDIIIGMSATPGRFSTYLSNQGGRTLYPVTIEPSEVRGSGLIKDRIILNGPEEGDAPWTLLSRAIGKTLTFDRDWRAYTTANDLDAVVPALLVQVEDAAGGRISDTPLDQVVQALRADWPGLGPDEVVHCFHGVGEIEPHPGWRLRYREPSTIADDDKIRVVLFKTALNTGWDCPRAEVLMSFRSLQDKTAIAQLVGRMVRTPLGERVSGDGLLNSTHLFLPYFDRAHLEQVKDQLTADLGDTGADVDTAGDIQELALRPDGTELFNALKALPTEVVPSGRAMPDIRRLLRTARALEQDGITSAALSSAVRSLVTVLGDDLSRKEKDKDFQQRLSARDRVLLSSIAIEDGLVVARETTEALLSETDVDGAFRAASLVVGEEVAVAWLRDRFDPDDPQRARLEFLELMASPALLVRLQQQGRDLLYGLDEQFRQGILSLNPARRDFYATLQRGGRAVQSAIMAPETRVVLPKPADAVNFPDHLLVAAATGEFFFKASSWEAQTLAEERRRGDYLGFLRNVERKRWALSYAYDYGGVRPGFPDFLVFRSSDSGIIVDILEPHLDHGDSLAKAKGLAAFALRYGKAFGRIEMLRKFSETGPLYRLPLDQPECAEAILRDVGDAAALNAAIRAGYVSE